MESISYNAFNENLSYVTEMVEHGNTLYRIKRRNHKNLVLMTEDNYNSILETMHLLSSKANADRLYESMDQAKKGQFVEVRFND